MFSQVMSYDNGNHYIITLTTYFIFSHICLHTNSGRFEALNTGFFCTSLWCYITSMATRETQTTIYPMSSADVTAVARKPIETGEWHPRSLWSSNKARPTGAGSRGMLALKQAMTQGHTRESRRSALQGNYDIGICELWSTSVSENRQWLSVYMNSGILNIAIISPTGVIAPRAPNLQFIMITA
jgi:hypothetical protein